MSCCGTCGTSLLPPSKPGPPRKWCSERCRKEQYAKACSGCGTRISGCDPGKSKGRCVSCSEKAQDYSKRPQSVTARERRDRIVVMWANGDKISQMAREMQISPTGMGELMIRMRRAGYDLPYRRTDQQRENMRLGREAVAA